MSTDANPPSRFVSAAADVVALGNRFHMYGLQPREVAGLFAAGLMENGARALPNTAPEIAAITCAR